MTKPFHFDKQMCRQILSDKLMSKSKPGKLRHAPKVKVILGKLLEVTPGGKHAWYESNVGPVRKQYSA